MLSGCESSAKREYEALKKEFYVNYNKAKGGDTEAAYQVGYAYLYNRAIHLNYEKAFKWLSKAAESGHFKSIILLAETYYRKGLFEKSLYWYGKLSIKELNGMKYSGRHFERIGNMYAKGLGTKVNYKKAKSYYDYGFASSSGIPNRNVRLAAIYFNGIGIARDIKKAEYYLKSYEDKYNAVLNSEGAYYFGLIKELQNSISKAEKYYKLSSYQLEKEFSVKSARKLADWYYNGDRLEQSDYDALYYYKRAAYLGDVVAQTQYAKMVYNGEGRDADIDLAHDLFIKAAELGNSEAQFYVALILINKNTTHDISIYKKAKMWEIVAAENSYITVKINKYLSQYLTNEQIKSSNGMAKRCIKSDYKHC